MPQNALEIADIFRDFGPAWRSANAGHVSLGQMKVMSAIERCRTAALGGHVARCENGNCQHTLIAYNSCRNRHCPKCQGLSRIFRRLVIEMLTAAHAEGQLNFFGELAELADAGRFAEFLAPLRRSEWVVYSKKPFGGPEAVLAYLSRYTHRVAISNRRLIAADANAVTFNYKDYRIEGSGRFKVMRLDTSEFIRRFLMHVLPKGFHRIRHYGLLANGNRAGNVAKARELLGVSKPAVATEDARPGEISEPQTLKRPCPCCGGRMIVIEIFEAGRQPRHRPAAPVAKIRVDTS